MEGFPIFSASEVIHEEIHRRTRVRTKLSESQEREESVGVETTCTELWLEYRRHAKDDDRDGKHEELHRQSYEHFRNARLFSAGDVGGSLATPSHSLLQPDCGDDGGDEGDDWTSHGQAKSVEDTIQSVQPFLVPEVVSSDVDLPGSPPGAHLVEARTGP